MNIKVANIRKTADRFNWVTFSHFGRRRAATRAFHVYYSVWCYTIAFVDQHDSGGSIERALDSVVTESSAPFGRQSEMCWKRARRSSVFGDMRETQPVILIIFWRRLFISDTDKIYTFQGKSSAWLFQSHRSGSKTWFIGQWVKFCSLNGVCKLYPWRTPLRRSDISWRNWDCSAK